MKTYDKVFVLGIDDLALKCAQITSDLGLITTFFNTSGKNNVLLDRRISKIGIRYNKTNKNELSDILNEENGKILLISAFNPVLLPQEVLNKPYLTAINCHHSLLPNHPGRNSEAWAIYKQDTFSGITWHEISPEVDAGDILIQRRIKLDDAITSFVLLKIQKNLAYESFLEIIEKVLKDEIQGNPQVLSNNREIHYSWEVPNGGKLNLQWGGQQTSAFLRSMDYGILEVLGKPSLVYCNETYYWKKYSILKNEKKQLEDSIRFVEGDIIIKRDFFEIRLFDFYKKQKPK